LKSPAVVAVCVPEPERPSTALLGPGLLAADVGVGWLLYAHVDAAVGLLLWAAAVLVACSLLADASRSVTTVVRRSVGTDGREG
jgi:type IV secretory pathway TrbD component